MARSTKETPHLRVRIEPRLLAKLERAREKEGRTLTGEIVRRLEQSFQQDDRLELLTKANEQMREAFESTQRALLDALKVFAEERLKHGLPPSRPSLLSPDSEDSTESRADKEE
jgi:hypothetical protein